MGRNFATRRSIASSVAVVAATFAFLLAPRAGSDAATLADPVIAAGGDIACASNVATSTTCRQLYTSDILVAGGIDAVAPLGDLQYESGTLSAFQTYYDPTWGRVKSITHPAVGNHEYGTSGASGYYTYFGSAAGDPSKGYYSYDLGAWHVVVLNSQCSAVACNAGSPQEQWLRADLAAHPNVCTLAYWHHPRFSSGTTHGSNMTYQPFWQALYDYGADVVMNGHEHNYERFAPQSPTGVADPNGIREFVAGTGGKGHYGFGTPIANSQVRNSTTFGVLKLTLHATSYDWQFVPEAGATFTDSGTAACVDGTTPPTGDFSISASPSKRTVARGSSTTYAVAIAPSGGFGDPVNLAVTGLPSGATASFSPNPATTTSTLTVSTSGSTPTGTSTLTITGTSGGLTHPATVTLVVKRH
jgi:hypothetical protein